MPELDVRTLFYLFAVSNFIIVLFFLAYIIQNKAKISVINIYLIARVLFTLVWLLFSLRGIISNFYTIAIANVLFLFGMAYEIYAIIRATHSFDTRHFTKYNTIPLLFSIIFILFISHPEKTRVIIASTIIFVFYFTSGIVLVTRKSGTRIQKLAGYILFIVALLFSSRAILGGLGQNLELFTTNKLQIISYISLYIVSLIWVTVLLLILKEADNRQIAEDNRKLLELHQKKNRFFSIIAHDLKSPIASLSGLGEALLIHHNEIPAKDREELINSITSASKNTFNLLENLLQWALSETGEIIVNPSEIRIKRIIEDTISLLQENINQKQIKIEVKVSDNDEAYADFNMISTVIRNLLSNAVKFSNDNGVIIINSKNKIKENIIEINITDNGVGIPEEITNNLLDIESTYSTKGTRDESGTGLGLKLCVEFMRRNKGEISLKSELGNGSTFIIELPCRKQ